MTIPDVLVVGAGVVGAACARSLAQRGLSVTVVDPGPLDGAATEASAGMLAPLVEADEDDPALALKIRGRDHCIELASSLLAETGIDIGFWSEGILHLAFSEEETATLKHRVAWQRQQGFAAEWLSPEEIRSVAPGVSDAAFGATLAPEDGALDPAALRKALLTSSEAAGTRIRSGEHVTQIRLRNDRVWSVLTDKVSKRGIRCGAVVIAAGCWSGRIQGLPRPISVEPVRGQMIALPWPKDEPPQVVYGAGAYLLYRYGETLVGATMEHVGYSTGTTDAAADRFRESAAMVYPSLAGIEATRRWAGLRPVTPDGHAIVGADPAIPNLYYATGHGRAGIMLGPLTGEIIADKVLGNPIEYDLSAMDPQRFWDS